MHHYPWATRLLLDLHAAGELPDVVDLVVEPRYGVVGRLRYRDGGVRPFTGNGLEGVNNAAAARIARDKGWTQFLLADLGYRVPRGEKFVLDQFAALLDRRLSRRFGGYLSAADAVPWVRDNLGYPVYAKPARGSKGRGVFRCREEAELAETIAFYESVAADVESFVVEEAVALPDFRVLVVDGAVLCAYRRRPLSVTGDGTTTLEGLVAARAVNDDRWVRTVARAGFALDDVIPDGLRVELLEVSNLSAGGEAEDLTGRVAPRWARLCAEVTRDAGLRVCGVDLAVADLTSPGGDYTILELNSSPGLDHYLAQGAVQEAVVREIFVAVFGRSPGPG